MLTDTLRADHLPFYGYDRDTAPFLTGLAQRGVVFEHVYSPSSWTAPATASLFTSLYPFQHRVITGLRALRLGGVPINRIPESVVTLAEHFKQAGYRTYGVSDNLSVGPELGFSAGFDRFESNNYRGAEAVCETLTGWAREEPGKTDAPYFLYIHFMDPHVPLHERPPHFTAMHAEGDGRAGGPGLASEELPEEQGARPAPEQAHHAGGFVGKPLSAREHHKRVAAYDSEIRHVDTHLKKLFKAFGWDRDTLLVFTADHGEEWGDHGAIGHGHTLYGEVINVPLMFHYPQAFQGGRRVAAPVSLIDVLPTLAHLIGKQGDGDYAPDSNHEGVSLLGWLAPDAGAPLRPEGAGDPRELYAHLKSGNPWKRGKSVNRSLPSWFDAGTGLTMHALIRDDHKYIVSSGEPAQLFDLKRDPAEQRNLHASDPEAAKRMRAAMDAYLKGAPRLKPEHQTVHLKKEESERLRALGYAQ